MKRGLLIDALEIANFTRPGAGIALPPGEQGITEGHKVRRESF